MIETLREINERLISYYKDDVKNLKKQKLIKKLLSNDDCFLKMPIETAYCILDDLQIPEIYQKEIYIKLI